MEEDHVRSLRHPGIGSTVRLTFLGDDTQMVSNRVDEPRLGLLDVVGSEDQDRPSLRRSCGPRGGGRDFDLERGRLQLRADERSCLDRISNEGGVVARTGVRGNVAVT